MQLSAEEKNIISDMFYKKKIYEYKNWVHVWGGYLYFPRRDDQIWVYHKNKVIATIEVSPDYVDTGLFPNKTEREIVAFRDKVWKIMNQHSKYKVVTDTVNAMRKKDPVVTM